MSISRQQRLIFSASLILPSLLAIGSIATFSNVPAMANCDPNNPDSCILMREKATKFPTGCPECGVVKKKTDAVVNPNPENNPEQSMQIDRIKSMPHQKPIRVNVQKR